MSCTCTEIAHFFENAWDVSRISSCNDPQLKAEKVFSKMIKNVVVAVSGGVDSAVAAFLLKNKGFNLTAIFMQNWDIINETGVCATAKDYNDAKWVCDKLKIPLVHVNFVKEYWNHVFSDLIEKYESGSTPNPDILCNKNIKFEKLYQVACNKFHADAVATGHYVKTSFGPFLEYADPYISIQLLKAKDAFKDQTFFLSQVPQKSLRHYMFPIGGFLKDEVKAIAREAGLDVVLKKKESMGICFVGKREFQNFISEYIEDKPGDFIDLDTGLKLGEHKGIHYWTVGQRCKISGCENACFVFQKYIKLNRIIVVKGTNHSALYTDFFITKSPHWINAEPQELKKGYIFSCDFRFQHIDPVVPCKVYKTLNNELLVQISQPLRAITKGQFAVFYLGDECLGSAEIEHPGPSFFTLNRQLEQGMTEYTKYNKRKCAHDSCHEKMRGGHSLNHFNDNDFFSGGPCPSCRLAINKETGRLKWCMGGNDTWRFRVKLMLLIPAVLLPITVIFIALSRSQVISKAPYNRTYLVQTTRRQDSKNVEGEIFSPTSHGEVERSGEEEEEDRILISGMKTSYVPLDSLIPSRSLQRRKREIDGENRARGASYSPYQIGSDNSRLECDNCVPSAEEREERDRKVAQKDQADMILDNVTPNTDVEESNGESGNFLDDYYSQVEPDEEAENFELKNDDYREYKELPYPAKKEDKPCTKALGGKYKDINTENREQDEADEGEQRGRYSVSIEDTDRWMPISDRRMAEDGGVPDFHAFWKGEGNVKSIREAQAKIMLKYMDKSADPCDDFYQYACGNWERRNPIPKDKTGYDTFEMLRESLDSVLRELLEDPVPRDAGTNTDDATIKAKHLFQSCMNYEILEQRMERPLIQLLDEFGGWPILRPDWKAFKFDWLLLVAQLRLYNNDILISEWVGPDIKNSDEYVIQFDQTSLGLPTRDYFLQPSNTVYLEAYKNYLINIATLLGASLQNATNDADEMIEFEIELAKITSSPDERRNVSELYQRMSIGELRSLVPQINWHRYLTIVLARPANISEPVVVYALQYIQDLVNLLSQTNPRTIANYLLWRFVRHRVNNLDDRFQEAKQRFYYVLLGREQAPSRWKNCVAQVNSNMGMALGSMFVRKYFDENSKNDTLAITQEIQRSFRELLNKTHWIDNETKRLATEKVNAMLLRIGYPDFILQPYLLNERYKDILIRPDKYFENTLNILQHLTRVEQDRLGSPVNKTLWNTAPAVVNAYYTRNKNQITFPAGILQPPFYHRYFPRSLNYGGIGVVIGHEITHGFDDKGRLFDKDGNLHRWWKYEAIGEFHQRAQCLIDQYSRYTVNEVGMQIDGINTQGENIADNGGIKQAFRAYERWLQLNGEADETLPGLSATGKQLFFLNFAQVWCGSMRPEATRNKLKTAVHSPGKFRVIGTLSNSKDFAEVYECPLGTPMNPIIKCSVW
ncbi:hypothetical protein KM043_008081 [Ampulex compressa]|nr:hypothetical protein KM043_008081 [Ampulex compressa]